MHAERMRNEATGRMIRQRITCIEDKVPKNETLKQKQHSRYVGPPQIGRVVSVFKTVGGA